MLLTSKNALVINSMNIEKEIINKVFGKKASLFLDFLEGRIDTLEITVSKLFDLSKKIDVPFSYFFLDSLPEIKPPIADFRGNAKPFSKALRDSIDSSFNKQSWFREYLIKNGCDKTIKNTTTIENAKDTSDIEDTIKELIDFDNNKTIKDFIDCLQAKNFIVQVTGVSRNNSHKVISVEECRGYAIYDEYAPLIFINTKDSDKAKIFTLLHELAHILLKQSGVSSYEFSQDIEYKCNNIAGNILMPSKSFKQAWQKTRNLYENVSLLERNFSLASRQAIATKAMLNNLISYESYRGFINKEKFKTSNKTSGGNSIFSYRAANSKNFVQCVISDTLNDKETYKNALNLLNVKSISTLLGLYK
ncbi:hypothetical protein BKH43_07460 [Helicobacter sp. 13S00401-1]|uniref:ImmA/IrrE family metallo-endopeptidase n=1 Tax=Helicobacter sp. 13S00401-1 TaxID=1905758 RepID=UPI000BA5624F|nr:ImmA/IrrE family metallo-endopeptidase [Helicobacter sp. 13S00401-1]PAF49022.1 hypothetical protein BKH43_07460 [Helicobacter sp. 13S00401-1]